MLVNENRFGDNRIPFNKAVYLPSAFSYVEESVKTGKIAGDGKYTKLCSEWMEKRFKAKEVLMTTSCTAALEMAAILLEIRDGDEVIMPSYTFVSTANAFVLRGAKCIFVDIRPDTMNINEKLIEGAISKRTKAIVAVHYAGVGCEMDGVFHGEDQYTTKESERIIRLPLFYNLAQDMVEQVVVALEHAMGYEE